MAPGAIALIKGEFPDYVPDARFAFTAKLLSMQKAGVQFDINDLSEKEWQWIAELKTAIEKYYLKV